MRAKVAPDIGKELRRVVRREGLLSADWPLEHVIARQDGSSEVVSALPLRTCIICSSKNVDGGRPASSVVDLSQKPNDRLRCLELVESSLRDVKDVTFRPYAYCQSSEVCPMVSVTDVVMQSLYSRKRAQELHCLEDLASAEVFYL